MRRALLVLSCAAASGVAHAQTPPRMIPTRDVDVTYDAAVPGAPAGTGGSVLTQRMRWSAKALRLRVDPPDPALHMITDYAAHRVLMVFDARREVLESDAPAARLDGADAAAFRLVDHDTVAGLDCTDWATTDHEGAASVVCVTGDGVLLRARREGRVALLARAVRFGPVDPAAFAVPPDYRRVGAGTPGRT